MLAKLADARRRADLLLAPGLKDPATRKIRDADLKALADRIADLDNTVRDLLPSLGRADKLASATPIDLQKALLPNSVLIDFLAYTLFEWDKGEPGKNCTPSYGSRQ